MAAEMIGVFAEKLGRLLRGDAHIAVSEGFPALFLEECRKRGIRLRYLTVYSDGLEARVDQKSLWEALAISAALGMHAEVNESRGIPHFIRRYRRRYGIPFGLLCAALILSVLSSFVWSVEIEGIERLDEEAFAACIKAAGLSQGVFLCGVDTTAVEQAAENSDPGIKKVTVNLIGCRAYVRVWERTMPPETVQEGEVCDLVAARDGEIVKADITAGTPLIRVGDGVKRGDMLASGTVPLNNGENRYAAASGIVIARTKVPVVCGLRLKQNVYAAVSHRKKYSAILFGCEFPLHAEKNKNNVTSMNVVSYLQSGNTVFPLGIRTTDVLYCEETPVVFTPAQALLICTDDLARLSADKLKKGVPVQREERLLSGDTYSLEVTYTVLENIAVQRKRNTQRQ